METKFKNRKDDTKSLLDDFPFNSKNLAIEGININYIDEGSPKSRPVVLLHGVPTWSYLFRNVIPGLLKEGYRVVVPDLPGFGRSDKPTDKEYYTFERLTNLISSFLTMLALSNIVFVGHDWGAILGMRVAVENKNRFAGLIISNGYIPRGDEKIHSMFRLWKFFTRYSPILPVGKLINMGCDRNLSSSEIMAYDLPFSSSQGKIAIRILPQLLPFKNAVDSEAVKTVWKNLEKWQKPVLTIFSNNDPISRGGDKIIQKFIPGAKGQNHKKLEGGHFLFEDAPEEIIKAIHQFIRGL